MEAVTEAEEADPVEVRGTCFGFNWLKAAFFPVHLFKNKHAVVSHSICTIFLAMTGFLFDLCQVSSQMGLSVTGR